MVVDVHLGLAPLSVLVAFRRQGLQGRALRGVKQRAPGALQFLEGPVIERVELLANGVIEIGERRECQVPQRRQDRALDDLLRGLHFRFGVSRALHPVMRISHKFSRSPIRSIRSVVRHLSC